MIQCFRCICGRLHDVAEVAAGPVTARCGGCGVLIYPVLMAPTRPTAAEAS